MSQQQVVVSNLTLTNQAARRGGGKPRGDDESTSPRVGALRLVYDKERDGVEDSDNMLSQD